MINAGTALGYLDLDTKKFEAGIKGAVGQLEVFNKDTATTGQKMEALGGVMKTTGATLTKYVSAPLIGVGALSIKTAADFESGMSQVSALSGVTGKDLKMLEDKAKEMGATTKFSATEATEAMSYMALAGWDAEQMAAGLGPSLYLAGAAGMELAQATDIVTDTMSMFGMEATEATKMTDMLAYAQANSNTDVQQLGEALKYCGASANAMGYDLADTTALLGTFADQGLKGSSAGTTLNAMFRDMKDKAEEGAIAIGDTNVAIVDSQGNYRDMTAILADVETATADMTTAERDMALSTIWGTEALKGINMAFEAGTDKINSFEEGIRNSDGSAKNMYDTMQDNLKGAIDNFKSSLEGAAIVIGERLIPMFQGIVEWLTDMLTWFNNLDESTQTVIVAFGAVVAAIGPLLLVGGTLLTMLPNMVAGFKLATKAVTLFQGATLAVPIAIGAAIAAFVGLVAWIGSSADAISFLTKEFGVAGEIIAGLCEGILGIVQLTLGNVMIILSTAAKAIGALLKGQFWKVDDIVKEGWSKVENNTAKAWSNIQGETTQAMKILQSSTEAEMSNVVNTLDLAMQQLPNLTKDNASEMARVFTDNMVNLDINALTVLRGTSDNMAILFEGIKEGMNDDQAMKKFTANLESMAVSGKFDMDALQSDVDKAMKTINQNVMAEGQVFKQQATDMFNAFKTSASQGMTEAVDNVVAQLGNMDQQSLSQLQGMGATWGQVFQGISLDAGMTTEQMKQAVFNNIQGMGIDSSTLISQLRSESTQHMNSMNTEADRATKDMKTNVTSNVGNMETEATKKAKDLKTNVTKETADTATKVDKDAKKINKSLSTETATAAKQSSTNMKNMSKDAKSSTTGVATQTDADFKRATKSIQQESTNMYNGAKVSFTKLAEVAKQAGSDAYNGVRVSFSKIPDIVKSSITSAASAASSASSSFRSAGARAGQAWIDGFNSKKGAMRNAVASVPKPAAFSSSVSKAVESLSRSEEIDNRFRDMNSIVPLSYDSNFNVVLDIKDTKPKKDSGKDGATKQIVVNLNIKEFNNNDHTDVEGLGQEIAFIANRLIKV